MKGRATLIRYPGAKANLAKPILARFPDYLTLPLCQGAGVHYVEPFFGSGAIGLRVMQEMRKDSTASIADADIGIVSLWRAVREHPSELKKLIGSFQPTVDAFYELKARDGEFTDTVDTGFRKLALHRLSVSGFGYMAGGPIGGRHQESEYTVDCRWKPKSMVSNIDKASRILNRFPVCIAHQDVSESLKEAAERQLVGRTVFAYLDPPYYEKGGELYKHNMDSGDHERLAAQLHDATFEWALSYDDHEEIRRLYAGCEIVPIDVVYSNAVCKEPTRRKNRELLILNTPARIF